MTHSHPPNYVLDFFNLQNQKSIDISSINEVVVSRTWLFEEVVLQSRPIQKLEIMLLLYGLGNPDNLKGLRFSGPLMLDDGISLIGADKQDYRRSDSLLWTLQPRLHALKVAYSRDMSDKEIMSSAFSVFPDVMKQLQTLAQMLPLAQVKNLPSTRGITYQDKTYSLADLKALIVSGYPQLKKAMNALPDKEKTSQLVTAHGDPLLKNLIIADSGVELIDFEAVSALPQHMDLTHITVFVCKQTDHSNWTEIINYHWQYAKTVLSDWDYEDWQLSVCFYLVRELAGHPPVEQLRLENFLKGLEEQVLIYENQ